MDTKILKQLEEAFNGEFDLVEDDLVSLEEIVIKKMRLLGQGLFQRLVYLSANGYKGSSLVCKCIVSMRFMNHRKRDVHTLFGLITIKRAYYYFPECGASFVHYDKAIVFVSEQLSSSLSRVCFLLAVDDIFSDTSVKIESIERQKVSSNTIEQVFQPVFSFC